MEREWTRFGIAVIGVGLGVVLLLALLGLAALISLLTGHNGCALRPPC